MSEGWSKVEMRIGWQEKEITFKDLDGNTRVRLVRVPPVVRDVQCKLVIDESVSDGEKVYCTNCKKDTVAGYQEAHHWKHCPLCGALIEGYEYKEL